MSTYDVIVIGVGGVGSAALYHAARRGLRVLGIDRFAPGHSRGSSHGQTRAIRMAYFEHPDYVPLLRQAYQLWEELEEHVGRLLFDRVGLLEVGPPDGLVVPGVLRSAAQHNLPVQQCDGDELSRRFPGFRMPEGTVAVFEENAGYLLVEQCVQAHVEMAVRHGAELLLGQTVRRIDQSEAEFVIVTDGTAVRSRYLVVAPGPWAPQVLRPLKLPLHVLIKHQYWYPVREPGYDRQAGCPVFFFEIGSEFFYGFPRIDERGVKVARHTGGEPCSDPLEVPETTDPVDQSLVERFLETTMPGVGRPACGHSICFYTMSPDGHFYVDWFPDTQRAAFVAGLSGHGFKFTSVLGKALIEMCVDQNRWPELEFLRVDR
ncbi:MAG: N-methyltryptophan oxidase [Pirellulaceae bacterium]|nr:MAG: N-methyltryptophan oxidase [Pirellulaceae bacterium]